MQGVNQLNQAQWHSGAEEHEQIVTSITEREEQLEVVASSTGQLEALLGG